MYDIISVGSATADVFVDTGIHEKKRAICYPAGSKLLIKNLFFSTGGGGTNTAVSFSRLGLKTAYLGVLGDDEHGKIVRDELKKEKVFFTGPIAKERTGYSVVLDSAEHERTILTYKGANELLSFSQISWHKLKTSWFYFSSMTGQSFETQKKLAAVAARKHIRIAYNPSSYQAEKGAAYLHPILKHTEVLVLNKEEAEMLAGTKNIFGGLHDLGPKIVCITDGKNGTVVSNGISLYRAFPHAIRVVERTGAGDAFASGFLAGLLKKKSIEFALQLGIANSESVIQYYGAKNILLKWNEAAALIHKRPAHIQKKEQL